MYNALGSKVVLSDFSNPLAVEYNEYIKDLINLDDVKKLDSYVQHAQTSRLQHSVNVSYYSYLICKRLHLNSRSAARAGLLHDLFLYDWHTEKQPEGLHAYAHPKVALRNAKKIADLNSIEEDAIVNHMFPVTITFPRYFESYVVSMVDKCCAVLEVCGQFSGKSKRAKKEIGRLQPVKVQNSK